MPIAETIPPLVQRQVDEEEQESIKTKSLHPQITPLMRRQDEEEEEGQAKSIYPVQFGLQKQEEDEEEQILQPQKVTGETPAQFPAIEAQIHSLRSGGQPLSHSIRAFFEPRFGIDFSQVKAHSDARAADFSRDLNARAATVGRNVFFNIGEYAPETNAGKKLLAHELAHVIQQKNNLKVDRQLETNSQQNESHYSPGEMSRIYWNLNTKDRFQINQEVDKIFQKETGITRKLDWSKPGDRPLARRWLRIRDQVMENHAREASTPILAKGEEKMVSTLCHRDFVKVVPGWVARHCFIWGHSNSIAPSPEYIRQNETITFDNENSGTPDPVPVKNTVCTNTFEVDPKIVRQKYKELCKPEDYNLVSFNCCTCAYMALAAAGAKLSSSDFPEQNQGIGLPDTLGTGWKKLELELKWWNDIDELEEILYKNYTLNQLQQVPLEMKVKWIQDLCRGVYTTENEGKIVIKLFKGTSKDKRSELYKLVEDHEWSGNWKEGLFIKDDLLVDVLDRKQLNELRNIINGNN